MLEAPVILHGVDSQQGEQLMSNGRYNWLAYVPALPVWLSAAIAIPCAILLIWQPARSTTSRGVMTFACTILLLWSVMSICMAYMPYQ